MSCFRHTRKGAKNEACQSGILAGGDLRKQIQPLADLQDVSERRENTYTPPSGKEKPRPRALELGRESGCACAACAAHRNAPNRESGGLSVRVVARSAST